MSQSADLLVGIDMGSTNTKAVAYRPDGTTVAMASTPSHTHYPRPNWAYYDAEELWQEAVTVLQALTAQLDSPAHIASVAIASFGEAIVPLDQSGQPTAQVIAWFDRRTIPQAEWLEEHIGRDRLFRTTGLDLEPIFSLCKMLWLKEHESDAFRRTAHWLPVADYIAYRLTGAIATNYSLASRALMFHLEQLDWDWEIVNAAGIPRETLPPPLPSGTRIGTVTHAAASATGLPAGIPVGTGGHDHVCGALAAGTVTAGSILDSMGTAEALFLALDHPILDPELGRRGYTQGVHVVPGHYYVFGGLYTSGACVDWLHDLLDQGHSLSTLLDAAKGVPVGSNGVVFLPHLRLGNAPHPDPRARAALIGLTSDTNQAILMRAVLEGIAFEARASLEPLLTFARHDLPSSITVIGGGSRNELLLHIKAAILRTDLRVLSVDEATALGAAILGGIAAGIYPDADGALESVRRPSRLVNPDRASANHYEAIFQDVYLPLYPALRDLHHHTHNLAASEPS